MDRDVAAESFKVIEVNAVSNVKEAPFTVSGWEQKISETDILNSGQGHKTKTHCMAGNRW